MLSVIIPAFNAADTLGDQLEALRTQKYESEWEVLVADNGSSDNTVSVVKQYQKCMPYLSLVNASKKQGPSHARNSGAQAAKGDALVFCDADDQVAPGWVAAMAKALERHDLVVGAVEVKTLNPTNHGGQVYGNNGMNDTLLNFWPYAISANCGISRQAFEEAGGFSEEFIKDMDVDLSWRLKLLGYTIYEEQKAIVYYRYRTSPQAMWRASFSFSTGHVQLYKRYAAHGMPRVSLLEVGKRYYKLLRPYNFKLFMTGQMTRNRWVGLAFQAGVCLGRLRGSFRHRVLYL